MKNGSWHVRYQFGPKRTALLAEDAGATKAWTNERGNDAVLPVAGFKTASDKPGFVRWERKS